MTSGTAAASDGRGAESAAWGDDGDMLGGAAPADVSNPFGPFLVKPREDCPKAKLRIAQERQPFEENSMKSKLAIILAALVLNACAAAPHHPYHGQHGREIKSLSAEEVRGYLAGSGMGFARTGELNHYPGPRHVLDAAPTLGLSPAQLLASQAAFDRMDTIAKSIGAELIQRERELDRLFASGTASPEDTRKLVMEVARLQGEIRLTHLNAHIEQRALLTPGQIDRYDSLRGYPTALVDGH